MPKTIISDYAPKYRCPKCGSYNILCKCHYYVELNKEGDEYYSKIYDSRFEVIYSRDLIESADECECLNCDNTGFLFEWDSNCLTNQTLFGSNEPNILFRIGFPFKEGISLWVN